jgi:hypothetical protein
MLGNETDGKGTNRHDLHSSGRRLPASHFALGEKGIPAGPKKCRYEGQRQVPDWRNQSDYLTNYAVLYYDYG